MQHDLPDTLAEEHRVLVNDLFEWLVDPCLEFIRHECKMLINTSPIHLVYSLQRLFSSLLDEIRNSGQEGQEAMTAQQVPVCSSSPRFTMCKAQNTPGILRPLLGKNTLLLIYKIKPVFILLMSCTYFFLGNQRKTPGVIRP